MSLRLIVAAIIGGATALTYKNYTINFEESDLVYTKPYDGLSYHGFNQGPFDEASDMCVFVCAHSFPFEAEVNYNAYVTSRYSNSTTLCFDPLDFYFGCNGQVEANNTSGDMFLAGVVANCTLTLTGYRIKPGPLTVPQVKQSFKYVPKRFVNSNVGVEGAAMTQVVLGDSFKDLRYLYFQANYTDPSFIYDGESYAWTAPPQLLVDDFHYGAYFR